MIDYVLSSTGQAAVHYIGHSMGTTGFMVMLNEKPEYAQKIKLANLLAPVAYTENMKSPLRILAPFVDTIEVGFTSTSIFGLGKWSVTRLAPNCSASANSARTVF